MAMFGLSLLLAACQRNPGGASDPASDAAPSSAEAGYVSPPQVVSVVRSDNGLALSGRSDPNARIRLSSLDGVAYGATANARGDWSITTPPPQAVRLFTLSEVVGSRDVPGGGYLAVLPSPGRAAVLLRVGGGSQVLSEAPGAPQVTAIDYDGGGGAVVSGVGKPGAPVRLTVDGAVAGDAKPDANGQFSVSLAGSLPMSAHEALVQSAAGQQHVSFEPSGQTTLTVSAPFRGGRQETDWRIDWLTPGGSEQTTLVLDGPAETSRP